MSALRAAEDPWRAVVLLKGERVLAVEIQGQTGKVTGRSALLNLFMFLLFCSERGGFLLSVQASPKLLCLSCPSTSAFHGAGTTSMHKRKPYDCMMYDQHKGGAPERPCMGEQRCLSASQPELGFCREHGVPHPSNTVSQLHAFPFQGKREDEASHCSPEAEGGGKGGRNREEEGPHWSVVVL